MKQLMSKVVLQLLMRHVSTKCAKRNKFWADNQRPYEGNTNNIKHRDHFNTD